MKSIFRIEKGAVLPALEREGNVLVYEDPSSEEQNELSGRFGIDSHSIHSALDPDEPSRLEKSPSYLMVIFRLPRRKVEKGVLFQVFSMGVFLYPDRLVVLTAEPTTMFSEKLLGSGDSVEGVFLNLLLESVRRFMRHLHAMNQAMDEIEARINVSVENRQLVSLFNLSKSLVYYADAIEGNSTVLERLKALAGKLELSAADAELLEDVLVENTQCTRQAEMHVDIAANMMDAHVSIVNNNLSILMKTLNLITIAIMVPTLVVSVFSMNVILPLSDRAGAFWYVLALAGISILAVAGWWIWLTRRIRRGV